MRRAPQGRRRLRGGVWVVACLVVAALAIVVVVARGGGGSAAASAPSECARPQQRSSLCPHEKTFSAASYLRHGPDFAHCSDFADQADAQAVLRADPRDPNHLDAGREGIACPELRAPKDLVPVASIARSFRCRPTDPRSARCQQRSRRFRPSDYTRPGIDEYDCGQFASQADAQAVLRFEPDDPNRLDADGDGIACPGLPAPKDLHPVVGRAPS